MVMKSGFPEILEWRKDPITGTWVIIASQRSKRPYDFDLISGKVQSYPCVFCEGMEECTPEEVFCVKDRGGRWQVRVVPNKFPALRREEELFGEKVGLFYERMGGFGVHEVIIETPDHNSSFADFPLEQMERVIYVYRERMRFWEKEERLRYCLIFKNQGLQAGASMFHSHSQLIATSVIPKKVEEELARAHEFYARKNQCIFCAFLEEESTKGHRLVFRNEHFLALVPYAARFSYETWILPVKHAASFTEIEALSSFSEVLKIVLQALGEVLGEPVFNFVLHGAPYYRDPRDDVYKWIYHWHLEIIPFPVRMAGFEWGTGFYINPVAPERAASTLRELVSMKVGESCAGN
ncbi:MAG: galactose-1-phosphate uridylyltransferase [Candidatus Caldatribacteriaceae bacterium]